MTIIISQLFLLPKKKATFAQHYLFTDTVSINHKSTKKQKNI